MLMNLNNIDIFDDNILDLVDSLDDTKVDKDDNNNNLCENCGSQNFETDLLNGIIVCMDCSLICHELLDKNVYNSSSDNYGCPINFYYPNSSLGTKVKNGKFSTIAVMEKWSRMPYKERSLHDVNNYIEMNCKKGHIPTSIIDNAKILFKRINDLRNPKNTEKHVIIRGINRKGIIAACVFNGAIMQNMPRSPKEIAEVFNIPEKQVTKGCRKLKELLPSDTILCELKSSQTYDFICRKEFSKQLDLNERHLQLAKTMSKNIKKLNIATDHQPPSIAAGSILLLSEILELNISKKLISKIFGISQVTIIKIYKKIKDYKNIITNDQITDRFLKLVNNDITDSETSTITESESEKDLNRIQRYL